MNITDRQKGLLEMAGAMFLSGTLGFFVIESGQAAFNVVFFRCLFGSIFLFIYCLLRGFLKDTGFTKRTFFMSLLGGAALVGNWVLLFSSFKFSSISIAIAVYHTQPFMLLLIGAILLKEKISTNKIIWVALAFIGVLLTIDVNFTSFAIDTKYFIGLLFAFCAAALYATATMITKKLKVLRPHLIALVQVVFGVALLLPFVDFDAANRISSQQWGYLVILGCVHTCLMYILMYSAFQRLPTPLIAVLSFIYPIVAIGVDYIFYNQSLNSHQFLGIAFILFGGFAVNQNLKIPGFSKAVG